MICNRKTIVNVFLGSWFLCALPLFAQTDEVELTRAIIQTNRQAIVAANLGLTEEEGRRFWPVYRDYRNELAKTGDRAVNLIATYEKNYENLSEETAEWINEFVAIEKEKAEVRAKWTPRLREILAPKKTARFLQIENKLDAIVNYDLADSIPLIR
jgi:hypothetical protein